MLEGEHQFSNIHQLHPCLEHGPLTQSSTEIQHVCETLCPAGALWTTGTKLWSEVVNSNVNESVCTKELAYQI